MMWKLIVATLPFSIAIGCSQSPHSSPEMKKWAQNQIEKNWGEDAEPYSHHTKIPSPLETDAMIVKERQLTESLKAFLHEENREKCNNIGKTRDITCYLFGLKSKKHTFAGVPADFSFNYTCENPDIIKECRLYHISINFDYFNYSKVADAMSLKFGEPDIETSVVKKNRMNASFRSNIRKWNIGKNAVKVEERAVKLDQGMASFTYAPLLRDVEKRYQKDLRPDDI